jgi:DNA-binding NarL/FixJ family response regulator
MRGRHTLDACVATRIPEVRQLPSHKSQHLAASGKRLTLELVREIAECVAAGEPHSAIAPRFGVSVETVGAIKSGKRWAAAIGEDLRARMDAASTVAVLDAVAAQQVMAALEAGRSGRAIAEEFGISPSMVSAIKHGRAWSALDPDLPARLAGQPGQGKALSASQVAEVKQRLLEGRSSRKIAAEFGVSASTVQAISRGKTWAQVAPSGR